MPVDMMRVREIALEAIEHAGADCEIAEITQHADGKQVCVAFTNDYGQCCHKLTGESGEELHPILLKDALLQYLFRVEEALHKN